MARCKDCIHYGLCKIYSGFIKNHDCELFVGKADVVPKSEVEKLQAEIEVLKAERNNYQTWYFQTVTEIEEVEAKVVREIIKDLVKFADDKERHFHGHGVWYIDADDVTDFITELKKKYTESEGKE